MGSKPGKNLHRVFLEVSPEHGMIGIMNSQNCPKRVGPIVHLIKSSQPNTFPRAHDLRKFATSLAFFRNMKIQDINDRTGWKSKSVFRKRYLVNIREVAHQ